MTPYADRYNRRDHLVVCGSIRVKTLRRMPRFVGCTASRSNISAALPGSSEKVAVTALVRVLLLVRMRRRLLPRLLTLLHFLALLLVLLLLCSSRLPVLPPRFAGGIEFPPACGAITPPPLNDPVREVAAIGGLP